MNYVAKKTILAVLRLSAILIVIKCLHHGIRLDTHCGGNLDSHKTYAGTGLHVIAEPRIKSAPGGLALQTSHPGRWWNVKRARSGADNSTSGKGASRLETPDCHP